MAITINPSSMTIPYYVDEFEFNYSIDNTIGGTLYPYRISPQLVLNGYTTNEENTSGVCKFQAASNNLTQSDNSNLRIGVQHKPDFDVEAIFQGTGDYVNHALVMRTAQTSNIEYICVDGVYTSEIGNGVIYWQTIKDHHKVCFKFKEGYDGYKMFKGIASIESARVFTSVGFEMFNDTSIYECAICDGITTIGEGAFQYTNLAKLWVGADVNAIGANAFYDSNLTDIYFYIGVETVTFGSDAFLDIDPSFTIHYIAWMDEKPDYIEELEIELESDDIPYAEDALSEEYDYSMEMLLYTGVIGQMSRYADYNQNKIATTTDFFYVTQKHVIFQEEYPISTFVGLTVPTRGNEYISYKVRSLENIIFEGRVYCKGQTSVQIRLDEICENYLGNEVPDLSQTIGTYRNYGVFELFYSYDEWETKSVYGTFRVFADWTYDGNIKNDINTIVDTSLTRYERGIVCFQLKKNETANVKVITTNLTNYDYTIAEGDFSGETFYATVYPIYNTAIKYYTVRITKGVETFDYVFNVDVVDGTSEHATYERIFYRNKLGGWAFLNYNRTSTVQDNFTISTYSTLDSTSDALKQNQYKKTIAQSITCKTNWIPDSKTEIVADAFASTQVYLQPYTTYTTVNSTQLVKANIVNTSNNRQNFFRNGRQFNKYTFQIQVDTTKKFI